VIEVRVVAGSRADWHIELIDVHGALTVPVASGAWVGSEPNGIPVTASGGWSASGDLDVQVLFLDTPHTLKVHCSSSTGVATVVWGSRPLHGASARDQHRHRRVEIS
jgi:hypothetical protein